MTTVSVPKSERTRQLIVEQAAGLFNQKGYAGTSMDDILKATGLSKGGIYGNFKSKEDIAIAAFEHAVAVVTQRVRQLTRQYDSVLDKLKASVLFYQENIFSPPIEGGCPIQNMAIEADDSNPVLHEKVLHALQEWQRRIIYILTLGIERGEVKKEVDPTAFAILFIGTLEGGILLARVYRDRKYFDVMATQLMRLIEDIKA